MDKQDLINFELRVKEAYEDGKKLYKKILNLSHQMK